MKFQRLIKLASLMLLVILLASGSANAASGKPPAAGNPTHAKRSASPTSTLFSAVKMVSTGSGWIVGSGGLILQYQGGTWTSYASPITNTLNAVDASASEAWAVGDNNTILHNTGSGWQAVSSPAPLATTLLDVNIVAPAEAWALGVAAQPVMLHYSNGGWTLGPTPPSYGQMSWSSPTDGWMVDGSTTAYHYHNGVWSSYPIVDEDGQGHTMLVPGLSVYMLDPNTGWLGVDAGGGNGIGYASVLYYQNGNWVIHYSRASKSCDTAACTQLAPSLAPACSDWHLTVSTIMGFATGSFYYGATYEYDDCNTGTITTGAWRGSAMIGQTVAQPTAISGVAEDDLWLLDPEHIYHWDGNSLNTINPCFRYDDVPNGYWAAVAINYLSCRGIVNGTSAYRFSPNAPAQRIEFAKMITLARGWSLTTPTFRQTFSDVPPSNPLYTYVETAYANGAVSGAAQATCIARRLNTPCFLPNDPISRAQAAVITQRAFGWPTDTSGGPHFSDVPLDSFAYGAVETCYHRGVVNGIGGGLFAPNANVTRAQLAVILYKALTNP